MKRLLAFILCGFVFISCETPKVIAEKIETESITCELTVYSPDIIRVVKYPKGGTGASAKKSYSVIMQPQKTSVKRSETESAVELHTSNISAVIDKSSGNIVFRDARTGAVLLKEAGTGFEPRPASDVDAGRYKISQKWSLDKDEVLIGLGQRQDADLGIRGKRIHLWNENMFIYIPFFASEKGYGLYWDNPGMSDWDDTGAAAELSSEVADCSDLYFMYGDGSLDSVIAAERKLGGKATMFPLWAHGYWQSRERYHNPDELMEALRNHREQGIPIDVMVQDWQYWGPNTNWNSMAFDSPDFVEAQKMIDYVHDNYAHLAISIWPSFGPDTKQFQELEKVNALLPFQSWPWEGGVKLYDPFNEKARDIYWNHLQPLVEQGIDVFWSDSTEPDHFDETWEEDNYSTADGSWRSVRNAYPLVTNMGIYDNFRAQKYAKRSVQMTRSAAFGIQRYATFSWSGDVRSTWEVFKKQIPSGLNYTICGIPYWNTDIGGFFNWWYEDGTHNPTFQELQVRWMQWSVFVPVMRNHISSPNSGEIYRFGEPGEWAYDEQKRAVELRYRLLPYIYSLAGMTVLEDGMLMRPLMMDFASDRTAISIGDEYMFGKSFLVHPITDPVLSNEIEEGVSVLTGKTEAPFSTYLPAGHTWYDFFTGKQLEGGSTFTRNYGISEFPVFIKAGSIIPYGPEVQYTCEKPWDVLDFTIYPGADGEFTLYEDAGDGYEYEDGEFTTIKFTWDDTNRKLMIGKVKGSYPGMIKERVFVVRIVGQEPVEVKYNGKQQSVHL